MVSIVIPMTLVLKKNADKATTTTISGDIATTKAGKSPSMSIAHF
jgi:hypothetical protein